MSVVGYAPEEKLIASLVVVLVVGVPAVLGQKTTILWKLLYFLVSLKDSPGWGGVYATNGSSGEENPIHG